jgi:uncharacterized protein YehS (DUF1456 family)
MLNTPELNKLDYLPNIENGTLVDIFKKAEVKFKNLKWLGTYTGQGYKWATVNDTL